MLQGWVAYWTSPWNVSPTAQVWNLSLKYCITLKINFINLLKFATSTQPPPPHSPLSPPKSLPCSPQAWTWQPAPDIYPQILRRRNQNKYWRHSYFVLEIRIFVLEQYQISKNFAMQSLPCTEKGHTLYLPILLHLFKIFRPIKSTPKSAQISDKIATMGRKRLILRSQC